MLLVPAVVRPSPIHGLGLFATTDIAAGTVVWRFTNGFDLDRDPAEVDALPASQRAWLMHYGYIDKELVRFILCADDYRYVNHSDAPNLAVDRSEKPYGVDRALRDIRAGEELTIDYSSFEASNNNSRGWSK